MGLLNGCFNPIIIDILKVYKLVKELVKTLQR